MEANENKITSLDGFSDDIVIKEAANRLQRAFQKEFGFPMRFGSFQLVFHNGKLDKVEDQFRNRRYFRGGNGEDA